MLRNVLTDKSFWDHDITNNTISFTEKMYTSDISSV